MNRLLRSFIGLVLGVALVASIPMSKAYAYSEVDCFDFQDSVISIPAGSSKTMWFRTLYDYTYYTEGSTSKGTYLECSFGSGMQNITFHIGEDEQGKNVFFHFYVTDERLETTDKHDCVEVYVQNIKKANTSVAAPLAGGKTGSIVQNDRISMLYSETGVPMASFSLTLGNGNMATYTQKGIVNNGANYFDVAASAGYATPVISESDKAVMLANGYAGVCINGKYVNWP